MASMVGWPTDADEGSVANEARWRSMARLWAPSGVVSGLAPTLAAGPIINVTAGAAWVDGHYAELGSPASESASANGLLVVRFTSASNLFELVYRDGVSTPTQSDAVWELPIGRMTGGALTDLRGVFTPGFTTVPNLLTAGHEVSSNTVSGTVTNKATATFDIPTTWVTWDCLAWCSFHHSCTDTAADLTFWLNIDGADEPARTEVGHGFGGFQVASVNGRRVGITATGSRSVNLQATRTTSGTYTLYNINLTAQAIRTS